MASELHKHEIDITLPVGGGGFQFWKVVPKRKVSRRNEEVLFCEIVN